MAVVRILFRSELRQRWQSWLLLAILIALVSGLALAGVAAGRRTASAFPRYLANHGYDVQVFSTEPIPAVASLPEVEQATSALVPGNEPPQCKRCQLLANQDFGVTELAPAALSRHVKLVSGRMPDQSNPSEVLASYTMQRDLGIRLGSPVSIKFISSAQRSAALNGEAITANGPRYSFTVVGIEASEDEFPATNGTSYRLYTTQALAQAIQHRTFFFHLDFVRLRHGAADVPRFQTAARKVGAEGIIDYDSAASAINSSIRPLAVGWWILTGLTALVGLVVLGQALGRQSLEEDSYATLRTLGVSGPQLALMIMARTAAIAATGVAVGLLLAYGLSNFTLVGEARLADPTAGFSFDASALLLGGLVSLAVVLLLGLRPAVAVTRSRSRRQSRVPHPSRTVAGLAGMGAPPSTLIGVRHALERGQGRSAVPVGSALVGSILAVTALCATAVFGASLTHLTTTPALYGQPFDLNIGVNSTGTPAQADQLVAKVEKEGAVTAITAGISADVSINGRTVSALAGQPIRGPLLLTTITGHLPDAADEVTLGRTTLRQVGAHVGSVVRATVPRLRGGTQTSLYRVVGVTSFSPDFGTGGLGTGALFDFAGFGAGCARGTTPRLCAIRQTYNDGGVILLHVTPDAAGRSALQRLVATSSGDASFPDAPNNLVNFGEAVNFPLILGSVLIVFGVATLLHVLVVSVTRRRREVGLLKSLGFVRAQVAFTLSWQTTTVALIGIVIGVPAGVAIGRLVWRAFATDLGVVPVPVVAPWVILAIAIGTLLVANLLAAGPAIVAARTRPASLLRSE